MTMMKKRKKRRERKQRKKRKKSSKKQRKTLTDTTTTIAAKMARNTTELPEQDLSESANQLEFDQISIRCCSFLQCALSTSITSNVSMRENENYWQGSTGNKKMESLLSVQLRGSLNSTKQQMS